MIGLTGAIARGSTITTDFTRAEARAPFCCRNLRPQDDDDDDGDGDGDGPAVGVARPRPRLLLLLRGRRGGRCSDPGGAADQRAQPRDRHAAAVRGVGRQGPPAHRLHELPAPPPQPQRDRDRPVRRAAHRRQQLQRGRHPGGHAQPIRRALLHGRHRTAHLPTGVRDARGAAAATLPADGPLRPGHHGDVRVRLLHGVRPPLLRAPRHRGHQQRAAMAGRPHRPARPPRLHTQLPHGLLGRDDARAEGLQHARAAHLKGHAQVLRDAQDGGVGAQVFRRSDAAARAAGVEHVAHVRQQPLRPLHEPALSAQRRRNRRHPLAAAARRRRRAPARGHGRLLGRRQGRRGGGELRLDGARQQPAPGHGASSARRVRPPAPARPLQVRGAAARRAAQRHGQQVAAAGAACRGWSRGGAAVARRPVEHDRGGAVRQAAGGRALLRRPVPQRGGGGAARRRNTARRRPPHRGRRSRRHHARHHRPQLQRERGASVSSVPRPSAGGARVGRVLDRVRDEARGRRPPATRLPAAPLLPVPAARRRRAPARPSPPVRLLPLLLVLPSCPSQPQRPPQLRHQKDQLTNSPTMFCTSKVLFLEYIGSFHLPHAMFQ